MIFFLRKRNMLIMNYNAHRLYSPPSLPLETSLTHKTNAGAWDTEPSPSFPFFLSNSSKELYPFDLHCEYDLARASAFCPTLSPAAPC